MAVAAVVRANPDSAENTPEVLAAWRSRSAVRGGVWELPGGKIEEGEDAGRAACRETAEELGITIEVIESLGEAEDLDHSQLREHHVRVELLLARSVSGDPVVTDRPWQWIPADRLQDFEWPKANRRLNEVLAARLATPID